MTCLLEGPWKVARWGTSYSYSRNKLITWKRCCWVLHPYYIQYISTVCNSLSQFSLPITLADCQYFFQRKKRSLIFITFNQFSSHFYKDFITVTQVKLIQKFTFRLIKQNNLVFVEVINFEGLINVKKWSRLVGDRWLGVNFEMKKRRSENSGTFMLVPFQWSGESVFN